MMVESYISPKSHVVEIAGSKMLCASGEQYNLPQGIHIATYNKDKSDDNDW